MTKSTSLTFEQLDASLRYDSGTGKFTWKNRPAKHFSCGKYGPESVAKAWNKLHAGNECFIHGNGRGYLAGCVFGVTLTAHRLAWMLHHGEWPKMGIDHINRNKVDNRICNLRLATASQNQNNKSVKAGGTSKYKGVCWHKRNKRWMASIRIDGDRTHIGYFNNERTAARAYDLVATGAFGKFACVNF